MNANRPISSSNLLVRLIWIPFLVTGCTLFGVQTVEEPPFKVVSKDGDVEIRQYQELVLVETTVAKPYEDASDEAFDRLFKYISGANRKEQKINMTAPVTMNPEGEEISKDLPFFQDETANGWRMSFVLPSQYTFDTAPRPTNPLVSLRRVEARQVAALRFTGRWRLESFRRGKSELSSYLESNGIEFDPNTWQAAAFNPPWTIPFLRRNEVQVELLRNEG